MKRQVRRGGRSGEEAADLVRRQQVRRGCRSGEEAGQVRRQVR